MFIKVHTDNGESPGPAKELRGHEDTVSHATSQLPGVMCMLHGHDKGFALVAGVRLGLQP